MKTHRFPPSQGRLQLPQRRDVVYSSGGRLCKDSFGAEFEDRLGRCSFMQVFCQGVLGAPKARPAKGTAESSALGETVLPQVLRKGLVINIKALT